MTAQNFVKGQIDSMVLRFPFIQCRYQFDKYEDTHYIEVVPKGYMEVENSLTLLQNEVMLSFFNQFPDQLITFFSVGGLIELDEVTYIKAGVCFDTPVKKGITLSNSEIEVSQTGLPVAGENNYALAA